MTDVRVLFYGDSFVAGVGDESGLGWVGRCVAAARARGVVLTPYNLGVRRETSRDVRARFEREAAPRVALDTATRVVFSLGANDTTIEGGRLRIEPDETLANLESLLERASDLGFQVFVVGPPPAGDEAQRARAVELSARMTTVAREVPFVEVAARLDRDELWLREATRGDGYHPGAGGYARLASRIRPRWLEWLGAPASEAALRPRRNPGAYVYVRAPRVPDGAAPVVTVEEDEGTTLVVERERADALGLRYEFVAAWITLQVHSSLQAVGLTAAVSRALADAGISANVVAGFAHDHLFVPHDRADDALEALSALA